MLENSDFIVDFGKRQLAPVEHLDVLSHDDYYRQQNPADSVAPAHISSTLQLQNGIDYLKESQIPYFKNAENIYKGGILKAYPPWPA